MKTLMRLYLRMIKKENRSIRLCFVGKRLAFKQENWVSHHNAPSGRC
jgi:hypothetical protein